MRNLVSLGLFAVASASCMRPALAIELSLAGDRYWAVLSSQKTADAAIGVAYGHADAKAFVVHAANGYFAVVAGPYAVKPGAGPTVLAGLVADHSAPKDTYLTRGGSFTATVWTQPPTHQLASLSYDGEHDVSLNDDSLTIHLSRQKATHDGDSGYEAVASVVTAGTAPIRMVMSSDYVADKPASDVALVRLDPSSPRPQAVFTYFWQGAHCCTITKIANLGKDGAWHVVEGETLDGGGGYTFADLEGKGFSQLISSDQGFYYAFDSYAGSMAPMRIHELVGDKLVDVTGKPRFQHRLLQDLYGDEAFADGTDGTWHSNGFLAAWVAESIEVGRGEAAWTRMLASYDHHSDFGPSECAIAKPLEDCPAPKTMKLAFPYALRQFLHARGYIGDTAAYPVPYKVEPN